MNRSRRPGIPAPIEASSLRPLSFGRSVLVGTLAGFLIAFALPPWGWWPLAIIGMALFDQAGHGVGAKQRFFAGWAAGAVWLAMGELWMFDLTTPGYIMVFVVFGAGYGLVSVVAGDGDTRLALLPAAFVLYEWFRWSWPFGGVPLATVPMTQANSPLAEVLPLGGGLLLTALTVLAGSALRLLFAGRYDRAALPAGAVAVAVLAGVVAPTGSPLSTLDVAVVQGGGEQNTRADFCQNQAVFDRHEAATMTIDRPVDLILWPENVVNPVADGNSTGGCDDVFFMSEAIEGVSRVARAQDAVFIAGWFHRDGPNATVNYVTATTPDGETVARYDKVRTVPFGEFVPLRGLIENFSDDIPNNDVRQGAGPAILETPIGTFGVGISWEIFFESRGRAAVREGGEVILNPTNGSSYWLTILQSQQIASSQLRARETGRWVLQAAPTGFSAIIDPDGKVLARTGISEQRVLYATVEMREGTTLATGLGAWPFLLAAVAVLVITSARSRLRERIE